MKKALATFLIIISGAGLVGCDSIKNQMGAAPSVGAHIGGKMGKSMDDSDKAKMNSAFENNIVGQRSHWLNSNTGESFTVVPTQNVTVKGNQYCRKYHAMMNFGRKQQKIEGTVCRQADGSWWAVSHR